MAAEDQRSDDSASDVAFIPKWRDCLDSRDPVRMITLVNRGE